MPRHYLDHASTSPPRPEVVEAMTRWLAEPHGDPGRRHHEGMAARVAVENAREQVAMFLGARPREVVFTSGATESIATAVWGAARRGNHMVVGAIEHSAVRAAVGMDRHTVVGCDATGRVSVDELMGAVTEDTSLVHCQAANHEVGTCQPYLEVAAACRDRGVLCHVDAAAAIGHVPFDFGRSAADLVSLGAHKFGGPPGIGVLLVRRGLRLAQLLTGGDQERARRAGYENVPAIVGLGVACATLGGDTMTAEASRQRALSDRLRALAGTLDGVLEYGHPTERLPHLVCLGIDDVEPQAVLLGLDQAGIAAHSGSACASEALEPSPVLEAMGVDAHHSLRLSAGWNTTDADIDAVERELPGVLARLRALRP